MIQITNASLSYGEQTLFDQINFMCQSDQKVGLLGRNGSGKSTLLKIIAGSGSFDEGSLTCEKGKKIGYLPQEVVLNSSKNVYEELLTEAVAYQALQYEKPTLEKQMEQSSDASVVERYAHLLETYTEYDVATEEEAAHKILAGLGFKKSMWNDAVSTLSVGWKMRLVLAKLLLADADFYLFDEPTNHLDLSAKEWLFDFLKEGSFGFMLVTHDRHYLDHACDMILALEQKKAVTFHGNYTQYRHAEEQRRAVLESAYQRQQKEIAQKKATIERFRAKASKAKMAQSMIKQLDKVERIELEPRDQMIKITFPPVARAGSWVLTINELSYSFSEKSLFRKVNGSIARGEKVALIAPNGTGKTTLFNLLTGSYPLQTGSIAFGHNVTSAVFEQDQIQVLNKNNTVLEEVLQVPEVTQALARNFLGSFLFSGDTVHKSISVLSGGERNRVAMVKVLLSRANVLLLDEPTNHLDLFAKEVLLKALQDYEGTLLFVSHDHTFIQELATRIWELTPEGIIDFPGTYEEYRASNTYGSSSDRSEKKNTVKKKKAPQNTKEIRDLERAIMRQEKVIEKIEQRFLELVYGSVPYEKAVLHLSQERDILSELTNRWESLLRLSE